MKRVVLALPGALILAAAALGSPAAASAPSLPLPASHAYSFATPNCVQQVLQAPIGARADLSRQPLPACFTTRADAYAYAKKNPAFIDLSDAQVAAADGTLVSRE